MKRCIVFCINIFILIDTSLQEDIKLCVCDYFASIVEVFQHLC